ncbi:ring finger domain-containing protein [Hirsutella rhossiliensis]|uniref:RING-type E3 ubiquitin transferase n=1 Tax=Hirsutella rhossiliensis TaxID=111463 RepID=A0A9P8MYF9_9HYPO|nr:ring finger domain-containing protein [Hirsutella rhossiliensis]KAH0964658.1 ring finger domain-containing protein [Hirsutella rhossiliensis]
MDPVPPWVLDREERLERQRQDEQDAADIGRCVVCLDALAEPCQLFPCGHRNFHFACVHFWLLQNPGRMCPICKAPVYRAVHGPADLQQTHEYGPLGMRPPPNMTLADAQRGVQPPLNTALQFGRARSHTRGPRPWRARVERDEPAGLAFRRDVYRRLRYSMHVGSNPVSRYRELTRDSFRNDDELQRRAKTFLRRELRVFSWLTTPDADDITPCVGESPQTFQDRRRATTVERLLGHIIWLLQHFELRGSDGSVEDVVTTHLGRENTRLLLHELHSFLRSPYSALEDWDRVAQYSNNSEARSGGVDLVRDRGASTERSAHEQRSATNRDRNSYRPRDSLVRPEAARLGYNRPSAPANESHAVSSRGPYLGASPRDNRRSRNSGSDVPSDDATRQRQDDGEETPRLASFVVNLCGPTKR